MAAQFTEVTLEDMEVFIKRAYRALRPKRGESRGEVYFDLNLSHDNIFIRVWTSIRPHSGMGADVGKDAIRVSLVTKGGKPLMPKGKIVKRTQNWRSGLQDRVDDFLEVYESKKEYWDQRREERDGVSTQKPATPPGDTPEPETHPGDRHEGQYSKLRNEDWGAKIFGEAAVGDSAMLSTKGGKRTKVVLHERIWKGLDPYSKKYAEIWTFEKPGGGRFAAGEAGEASEASTASNVAQRFTQLKMFN